MWLCNDHYDPYALALERLRDPIHLPGLDCRQVGRHFNHQHEICALTLTLILTLVLILTPTLTLTLTNALTLTLTLANANTTCQSACPFERLRDQMQLASPKRESLD